MAFVAAGTSLLQTTEQNRIIRAQNRASGRRFNAAAAAARQRYAAEVGAAETEFLQENEAESQELQQVGREAAKAAGALAARKGTGTNVDSLLNDIILKEGEFRAASRRNATLRRGAFVRSATMSGMRAQEATRAAWTPPTPTTGILASVIQAGASGLSMWASTNGNRWDEFLLKPGDDGGGLTTPPTGGPSTPLPSSP